MSAPGQLYLVATPIGNLKDLSERALETLRSVDFIVCEDTRHSGQLLRAHGISKELVSLPAFAEGERAARIIERLAAGERGALVTDAGTPAISDPGERLVAEAVARGVMVTPIPGPAAFVAALTASGLPTSRFHFLGFLPRQESERRAMLEEVAGLEATLVLYESARRLADTLGDLRAQLGERRACVARELTKVHEELVRGSLSELESRYRPAAPLGEIVIIVEGRRGEVRWSEDEVERALDEGLARGDRLKVLATEIAKRAGWTSGDVYRLGVKRPKPR